MNNKIKLTVIPFLLALGACSSSTETTTTTPGGGGGGSKGTIDIVTVSGVTETLTGLWAGDCRNEDGVEMNEALFFAGSTVNYEQFSYTTTDLSCGGTATSKGSYAATVTTSSTSAISSWIIGNGSATSPPAAQDGSGPLSITEDYTPLTYKITAIAGLNGAAVGDSLQFAYILDDTSSSKYLYRISDDTTPRKAQITDFFIK